MFIKHGKLRLARDLLSRSAISANTFHNDTSLLHVAAEWNQVDMIRFLLLQGADLALVDGNKLIIQKQLRSFEQRKHRAPTHKSNLVIF